VRGSPTLIEPWRPVTLRWNGIGAAVADGQVRYSTLEMRSIRIEEKVGLTSLRLIDPCSDFTSKLVLFFSFASSTAEFSASPRRLMLASTPPHFESNFTFFLSSSNSPAVKGGNKVRGTDMEGS